MSVRIAGVASTAYARHDAASARELFGEAVAGVLDDSAVPLDDVGAVYVGNFMGEVVEDQGHTGALLADYGGMPTLPSVRVESACASGGAAVRLAANAVAAGVHDAVLVGGAEMMYPVDTATITAALANAADNEYEEAAGLTFPGIYAVMARRYMDAHDATRADLAAVSVKNHANGVDNPLAQFHRPVDVDDVVDARPIATPLGLLDCCPISDGASALVLVSDEYARQQALDAPVEIAGSGASGDHLALQDRETLRRTPAAERAAADAYADAGIEADDVDVAEVHDCFTIAEVLAVEALGFYPPGEGIRGAVSGETRVDGRLPVNPSGGLLAKGHPVGVTGVGQLVELTKQLEGRHPNQVADAEIGLAHNVGGSGASAVVHVLRGA